MTPIRIATVVEGDGEVKAVPVLIRRIGAEVAPLAALDVARPIRAPRGLFLKEDGLERYVNLAASRAGADGRILVLLDANGDCPAELGPVLLRRARAVRPDLLIEIVIAKREYEAWFIATVDGLRGIRGIAGTASAPPDPESIRGAKEWLRARMSGPYSRPSRSHGPFRYDAGAPSLAVVRQDVALGQRFADRRALTGTIRHGTRTRALSPVR